MNTTMLNSNPALDPNIIRTVISHDQAANAYTAMANHICKPFANMTFVAFLNDAIDDGDVLGDSIGDYDDVYDVLGDTISDYDDFSVYFRRVLNLLGTLTRCLSGRYGVEAVIHDSDVFNAKRDYAVVLKYMTILNGVNLGILDGIINHVNQAQRNIQVRYHLRGTGKPLMDGNAKYLIKRANKAIDVVTPVLTSLWQLCRTK